MIHEVPNMFRLSLAMDNMRLEIMQSLHKHFEGLESHIEEAIKVVCSSESIRSEFIRLTDKYVKEAMDSELKSFFTYGPGRKLINATISDTLDKLTKEQLGNTGELW